MTLRLCFLGNSHVAALREAWLDNPGRWPGIDATFIGAHKGLLLETEVRDGQLVPTTEAARSSFQQHGGLSTVDLGSYDGFIVVGCLVAMTQASLVYTAMRWPGLPSLSDTPDNAPARELLVSYAAARATLVDNLSMRVGPVFVRRLRAATGKPIWLIGTPRVSERLIEQERPNLRAYAKAVKRGDAAALAALYEDAATAASRAAGAIFVSQPAETVVNHVLSAAAFMDGAHKLSSQDKLPQPQGDIGHGNARYGAVVLDLVAQIATAPQPT